MRSIAYLTAVALCALSATAAVADMAGGSNAEEKISLKPNKGMPMDVGGKRVVTYFEKKGEVCGLTIVLADWASNAAAADGTGMAGMSGMSGMGGMGGMSGMSGMGGMGGMSGMSGMGGMSGMSGMAGASGDIAPGTRIAVDLTPGHALHVDAAANRTVEFVCGSGAGEVGARIYTRAAYTK